MTKTVNNTTGVDATANLRGARDYDRMRTGEQSAMRSLWDSSGFSTFLSSKGVYCNRAVSPDWQGASPRDMKTHTSLTTISVLFIIAGAVLTLENFNIVSGISSHWPLFILLVGTGFTLLYFQSKRGDVALVWLGTFLLQLGLFFYYLNFTSWTHMARLWPLFLGIVGVCFLVTTILTRNRIFLYISILFVALFGALWLVFSVSLRLWPLSLVVFGMSLLSINFFAKKEIPQQKVSQ